MGGLKAAEIYCSQLWRLKFETGVPAGLNKSPLVGHWLLTVSSHGWRGEGFLWSLIYEDMNLIHWNFYHYDKSFLSSAFCPMGFPSGSDGKESTCSAGDPGSIPGLGRYPGDGNGNPFQYSYLENSMDRSLTSCSPRGCKELDTTEWLTHPPLYYLF